MSCLQLSVIFCLLPAVIYSLTCYNGMKMLSMQSLGTGTDECDAGSQCYTMSANTGILVNVVKAGCSKWRCMLARDSCITTTFQYLPVQLCCCSYDRCNGQGLPAYSDNQGGQNTNQGSQWGNNNQGGNWGNQGQGQGGWGNQGNQGQGQWGGNQGNGNQGGWGGNQNNGGGQSQNDNSNAGSQWGSSWGQATNPPAGSWGNNNAGQQNNNGWGSNTNSGQSNVGGGQTMGDQVDIGGAEPIMKKEQAKFDKSAPSRNTGGKQWTKEEIEKIMGKSIDDKDDEIHLEEEFKKVDANYKSSRPKA